MPKQMDSQHTIKVEVEGYFDLGCPHGEILMLWGLALIALVGLASVLFLDVILEDDREH